MQRPTPGSPGGRRRSAAGTAKPARSLGGRAVRGGYPGCWEEHPRDRARADRRAAAGVVARALLAPERTDRRGGRSGRLGRARHVERALRARADRGDRPLARTTTRTPAWLPWSSREGRGSRGVGVHRSCREGPDWPVLPRPSSDTSCPSVALPGGSTVAPALLGSAVTRSPGCCSSRSGLLLSRAWGRVQEAERERSDRTLLSAGSQDIVYVTGYVSHCTGCRCNLVHKMPCPESRAVVR